MNFNFLAEARKRLQRETTRVLGFIIEFLWHQRSERRQFLYQISPLKPVLPSVAARRCFVFFRPLTVYGLLYRALFVLALFVEQIVNARTEFARPGVISESAALARAKTAVKHGYYLEEIIRTSGGWIFFQSPLPTIIDQTITPAAESGSSGTSRSLADRFGRHVIFISRHEGQMLTGNFCIPQYDRVQDLIYYFNKWAARSRRDLQRGRRAWCLVVDGRREEYREVQAIQYSVKTLLNLPYQQFRDIEADIPGPLFRGERYDLEWMADRFREAGVACRVTKMPPLLVIGLERFEVSPPAIPISAADAYEDNQLDLDVSLNKEWRKWARRLEPPER